MKTVKEVSILSGVSVRTLHHYDKIGLFPPTALSEAGYRLYDDEALIRLQEILLFRELEFPLKDIKYLLEQAKEERQDLLAQQIKLLEWKRSHLEQVITHAKRLQEKGDDYMNFDVYNKTELEQLQAEAKEERQDLLAQQIKLLEWKRSHLEQVITHAKRLQEKGDDYMNFDVYNKTELEQLQAEAKEKWGQTAAYKEFAQKHASDDFAQISQEMAKIMVQFGQLKTQNVSDESVQMCVKRLQDYISQHFYTCTNEILAGLGQMYQSDDRFSQSIDKAGGAGTSEFVSQAIAYYCQ
ncbi:TipAS antibiotic-recognition domain-containing protein [Streptococcus agalactiae]|nr:TipAS antibiotic-recognition domain-containing protein [Streptococcus agalactiae]HEO3969125.1 TipAS antibiotic-recognition domain-containing protein [Streptococcus agalactiae]